MFKAMLLAGALLTTAGAGYLYQRGPAAAPAATVPAELPRPVFLSVSVTADRGNIYSRPWDGVGYIGGIVGPLFPGLVIESPPDMILCVVGEDGAACLQNGTEEAPESYCHDGYRCDWTVEVPARGPFALVVYDSDVYFKQKVGDLVDALIVNPDGADSSAVEDMARQLIGSAAPTAVTLAGPSGKQHSLAWRRGEEKRRARPMRQFGFNACTAGCRLEQSDVTISPDRAPGAAPGAASASRVSGAG